MKVVCAFPFSGCRAFVPCRSRFVFPAVAFLGPGEKEKEAKLDGLVSIGLERQIVMIRVT